MLFKYQTRIHCVLVIHNLYLCKICSTNIVIITDSTEYYFKKMLLHTLYESFCQWHFMADRLLAYIYIFFLSCPFGFNKVEGENMWAFLLVISGVWNFNVEQI